MKLTHDTQNWRRQAECELEPDGQKAPPQRVSETGISGIRPTLHRFRLQGMQPQSGKQHALTSFGVPAAERRELRDDPCVTVSNSAEFKSFLLIMCNDAPESTTKSLSSRLRVDARRHLFSEGEKNVALSCSFNFGILSANLHSASRADRSCHSASS